MEEIEVDEVARGDKDMDAGAERNERSAASLDRCGRIPGHLVSDEVVVLRKARVLVTDHPDDEIEELAVMEAAHLERRLSHNEP